MTDAVTKISYVGDCAEATLAGDEDELAAFLAQDNWMEQAALADSVGEFLHLVRVEVTTLAIRRDGDSG